MDQVKKKELEEQLAEVRFELDKLRKFKQEYEPLIMALRGLARAEAENEVAFLRTDE